MPPGFTSRDSQPDDSAPGVAREIQSKADVRPEPGKSEQSVSVSTFGGFTPMKVASAIFTKVVIVGAAAVAPLGSNTTTLAESQQTDAERAGTYLNSLLADDDGKFQQIFTELMINYAIAANGRLEDLDDYAAGFAKGFFVDGFWGNVTGLWEIAKFSVWFGWNYNPHMLRWRYWTGDDFAKEKEFARKTAKVADTVYKIINRMGAKLGEGAFEQYRVIQEGSPQELRALGDKHKQFAAFILALNVELSKIVRDMSPEEKARIFGAITWEIAQTAVELIFTGGAAKAVTGTAKFAHIADKLADFARYSDKFGDVAKRIAKLFDEGGELRTLANKFDDVPDTKNPKGTGLIDDVGDLTSEAAKLLRGNVPADPKTVARLRKEGVPIEIGTTKSRAIIYSQNKKAPNSLSIEQSGDPANAVFRVDSQGKPTIALRKDATRIELQEEYEHYQDFLALQHRTGLEGNDLFKAWKKLGTEKKEQALMEIKAHHRVEEWLKANNGTEREFTAIRQRLGRWQDVFLENGGAFGDLP